MFKKMLLILLFIVLTVLPAQGFKFYVANCLTGGTTGCLDKIDGSLLSDGDIAFVGINSTDIVDIYKLDASLGGMEAPPDVITPDTNAGTKRWSLLKGEFEAILVSGTEIVGIDGIVNKAVVEDSGNWDIAFTHKSSTGTDHANVVLNDTHRASDGTDHANVVLNDTHRADSTQAHSDYVRNNIDDQILGALDILKTTTQLKLSYDATYFTEFFTEPTGDFTKTITGDDMWNMGANAIGNIKWHLYNTANGNTGNFVTSLFDLKDDGNTLTTVFRIKCNLSDITAGSEIGKCTFDAQDGGGALTTAITVEGKDVTFAGEVKGTKAILEASLLSSNITVDQYFEGNGSIGQENYGWVMPRAGSITGITARTYVTTCSSCTVTVKAYKNSVDTGFSASQASPTASAYLSIYNTQARGTDTFVAGDRIQMYYDETGTGDLSFMNGVIEVMFDD